MKVNPKELFQLIGGACACFVILAVVFDAAWYGFFSRYLNWPVMDFGEVVSLFLLIGFVVIVFGLVREFLKERK